MGPISRAQLRKRAGDPCLASNFSLSTSVILRTPVGGEESRLKSVDQTRCSEKAQDDEQQPNEQKLLHIPGFRHIDTDPSIEGCKDVADPVAKANEQ